MNVIALYPYLVAAHVTAVVFLVGGMLAQDRMVKEVAKHPKEQQAGTLTVLLWFDRCFTAPALLLTWVFGLSLAVWAEWFPSLWLMFKLVVVVALSAFHGMQSGRLRRLVQGGQPEKRIPGAGFGIVLAMLTIAVLAIVKPN